MFEISRNISQIKKRISEYVKQTEREMDDRHFRGHPSCLNEVNTMVDSFLERYKKDDSMKQLTDDETDRIVHITLHTVLWEGLSSGRYHLYRGLLKPIGEQMYSLLREHIDWSINHGMIPREEKDEYLANIINNIKEVG